MQEDYVDWFTQYEVNPRGLVVGPRSKQITWGGHIFNYSSSSATYDLLKCNVSGCGAKLKRFHDALVSPEAKNCHIEHSFAADDFHAALSSKMELIRRREREQVEQREREAEELQRIENQRVAREEKKKAAKKAKRRRAVNRKKKLKDKQRRQRLRKSICESLDKQISANVRYYSVKQRAEFNTIVISNNSSSIFLKYSAQQISWRLWIDGSRRGSSKRERWILVSKIKAVV